MKVRVPKNFGFSCESIVEIRNSFKQQKLHQLIHFFFLDVYSWDLFVVMNGCYTDNNRGLEEIFNYYGDE